MIMKAHLRPPPKERQAVFVAVIRRIFLYSNSHELFSVSYQNMPIL